MRVGSLIFSALHFFVVFFMILVGAFFLALPYAGGVYISLINALLNHLFYFQVFGGLVLAVGILFLIGLYVMHRNRFFQIQMEPPKVEVDDVLIRSIVQDYWKHYFPKQAHLTDVVIKSKQELEIFASLSEERDEVFFATVEKELGMLLARQLGYQKPFTLTLVESF